MALQPTHCPFKAVVGLLVNSVSRHPPPLSGFSQSGMGGTTGSGHPPFQTATLGQTGTGSAMDAQKSSGGLFGVDNKTTGGSSSPFKTGDLFSSGGPGFPSMDHSTGIRGGVHAVTACQWQQRAGGRSQENEERARRNLRSRRQLGPDWGGKPPKPSSCPPVRFIKCP